MKATTANLNYIKHNHYDWPLQIVLQMQLLFLDFCLTKNKAYKSILPSKQKALDKLKHNKKETKNKKKRKKKEKTGKKPAKMYTNSFKKNKDLKADMLQLMSRSSFVFFS